MTKKNIFLVLIIVVFFSVMVISIWGKNSDTKGVIPATGITFYDMEDKVVEKTVPKEG